MSRRWEWTHQFGTKIICTNLIDLDMYASHYLGQTTFIVVRHCSSSVASRSRSFCVSAWAAWAYVEAKRIQLKLLKAYRAEGLGAINNGRADIHGHVLFFYARTTKRYPFLMYYVHAVLSVRDRFTGTKVAETKDDLLWFTVHLEQAIGWCNASSENIWMTWVWRRNPVCLFPEGVPGKPILLTCQCGTTRLYHIYRRSLLPILSLAAPPMSHS